MVFEKHLRFSWAYVVWAAVMCGISYWKIGSFGRLAIVIFPCFVVASVLLKNRYLLLFVTTSFLLVLLVNLFNFSHWRWVA